MIKSEHQTEASLIQPNNDFRPRIQNDSNEILFEGIFTDFERYVHHTLTIEYIMHGRNVAPPFYWIFYDEVELHEARSELMM